MHRITFKLSFNNQLLSKDQIFDSISRVLSEFAAIRTIPDSDPTKVWSLYLTWDSKLNEGSCVICADDINDLHNEREFINDQDILAVFANNGWNPKIKIVIDEIADVDVDAIVNSLSSIATPFVFHVPPHPLIDKLVDIETGSNDSHLYVKDDISIHDYTSTGDINILTNVINPKNHRHVNQIPSEARHLSTGVTSSIIRLPTINYFKVMQRYDYKLYISTTTPNNELGTPFVKEILDVTDKHSYVIQYIDQVAEIIRVLKIRKLEYPDFSIKIDNRFKDSIGYYFNPIIHLGSTYDTFISNQNQYLSGLLDTVFFNTLDKMAIIQDANKKWKI